MAKKKIAPMNIFKILADGLFVYLKNIIPLTQAMLFPIFGQVLGVIMILGTAYFYTNKYIDLLVVNPFFNNAFVLFSILLLITIPGFFIFTKAFWHLMIVMVSINPMIADMYKDSEYYQAGVYDQNVRLRTKDYIGVLLLLTGLWVVAMFAPLIFLGLGQFGMFLFVASEAILLFCASILSIYLCLSFQVFGLEISLSPIDTLKRSYGLIKGNFLRTIFLGIVFSVVTSVIIPYFTTFFSSEFMLTQLIARPIEAYFNLMFANIDAVELLKKLPDISTVYELALISSESVISMLTAGLLIPLGSAWYTLLYKDIINRAELAAIAREKKAAKSKRR